MTSSERIFMEFWLFCGCLMAFAICGGSALVSIDSAAVGRFMVGAWTERTFGGFALPVKMAIANIIVKTIINIPPTTRIQPKTLLVFF